METFELNNGLAIPAVGMGTGFMNKAYNNPKFFVKKVLEEFRERVNGTFSKEKNYNPSYEIRKKVKFSKSIRNDVEIGYELFDTAFSYNNCAQMSRALNLKKKRDQFFIISKCSNYHQRNKTILDEFYATLQELGTDYIDLYLIHWPQTGCFVNTWKVLEDLYLCGKVKSIGVSNFSINNLKELMETCRIVPMVNEVECHPMLQQRRLRDFCNNNNIKLIAHTPVGKMRSAIGQSCLSDIAKKYGKSITQVILRWHYQLGDVSIPNTLDYKHAKENIDIFDFQLTGDEMDEISKIDCDYRIWPNPENCNFNEL